MNINLQNSYFNKYAGQQQSKTPANIAFGICIRHSELVDTLGIDPKRKKAYNATRFYREDFSDKFTDVLIKKFPNRVKIYNYACSDGSEPYSIIMSLKQKLGEKEAEKYFPIIAKDIGKEVIEQAKTGIVKLDALDKKHIKTKINFAPFDKLFMPLDKDSWQIQDRLRKCVRFENANIVRDAKDEKAFEGKKPCIVIFRNALYHLTKEAEVNLMKDFYNNPNFPSGSIIYFSPPMEKKQTRDFKLSSNEFIRLDPDFKEVDMNSDEKEVGHIYKKL